MSSSVIWLANQLKGKKTVHVLDENCLEIDNNGENTIVYCPTTDEYEITSAIVQKAKSLGVKVIAYPHQWCKATSSAISSGNANGIKVIPFGAFFESYG